MLLRMDQLRKLDFVHLHGHSGYSWFDGCGTCDARAEEAVRKGQNALVITDHGHMSGAFEHWKACKKVGIKPIIGLEAYFMQEFQAVTELRRHLTLFAMNQDGYISLCHLMTESTKNFYYRQIIDFKLLEQYNKGVICLSGCVLGEIAHQIINDNMDEARRVTERFLNIFGDRFYFEVQPQNFPEQKKANEGLIKLSQEFDRPTVMSNDFHYVDNSQLDSYMLFRRIGRNEVDEIKAGNIREQYKELYICSSDTMAKRWYDLMGTDGSDYIEQSQIIADRVEEINLIYEEKVPEFVQYDDSGSRIPNDVVLANMVKEGLKKKGLWLRTYIDRAKYELSLIIPKKTDYYLMVADLVNWAKNNNIPVGPGRGSGAASLVAYAIGITDVDPIVWDLMFERFINPDRLTLPDFDIDFSPRMYKYVLKYLETKYNGQIASIVNIIRDMGDNLINDLGKILEMSKEEIAYMKSAVGRMGYKQIQPVYEKLMTDQGLDKLEQKYSVITHFCNLFGNPRSFSQHASGVVILPGDISNFIPLVARGSKEDRQINTSFHKKSLEEMGIVKVDALKVDTVDIVYDCAKLTGVNVKDIPLDDDKVFMEYRKLNTRGIFQFDSPSAKSILRIVKPETIFELAAATSLNRPGSSNMGMVQIYAQGKKGNIDKSSILYQFCSKTNGALIYQEQVMMACIKLARMSWGSASKVMKSLDGLPEDHPLTIEFVEGAMKYSGLTRQEALKIFTTITQYTFNAGHAAAYTVLSYWSMWFKKYYKKEFYLSLFRAFSGKKDDVLRIYEADAVGNRIPIFTPHVNGTSMNYHFFEAGGDKVIRKGIITIDGVGKSLAPLIIDELKANGEYKSEEDFVNRVNGRAGRKAVNKKVLQNLKDAGALEFDFNEYKNFVIQYNKSLTTNKKEWRAVA